jgi:hypothetical protein
MIARCWRVWRRARGEGAPLSNSLATLPSYDESAACLNSDGERPYASRKAALKWLWLETPTY